MRSRGEATKEKILDAAAKIICRQGFEATSINDLLEVTGIKKGSLYFHFPGKEAIGLAFLEKARAEFMEFVDLSLIQDSPGEALDYYLNQVLKRHMDSNFIGGCIFGNIALEMGDKHDEHTELTAFIENVFDEWAEKLRRVIVNAQASGEVGCKLPANIVANHIITAIQGGVMLSRLKKDEKPLRNTLNALRALLFRK